MLIELVLDDITRQCTDAIVNAANESLLGGSGVDGAIHRAAGPELLDYCRTLGGCATGQAKIAPGFRLSAKWVVLTVGPVWYGGGQGEAELLACCYTQSLARAAEVGATSIAFPAISTGVYGYPIELATHIAVDTVRGATTDIAMVRFVCFDNVAAAAYQSAMETGGFALGRSATPSA